MATFVTYAAPIADTLAHWTLWAQSFGQALTSFGWIAQTGHGELPATGSGASYAFTNPVLPAATVNPMSIYTYRGAWVSGTNYTNGSNTAGGTADLVTDNASGGNGITYVKITTTNASNTTAPHSNATDWLPLQFEIWKSNGANSASLPLYLRLAYTTAGAANNTIRLLISLGTGIDANGNVTGSIPWSGTVPTATGMCDDGAVTSSTLGEMDFAGDADNFRCFVFRGHPTTLFGQTLVIDRAKNSQGADTDAYVYVGSTLLQQGATQLRSCIIPNSAIGAAPLSVNSATGWLGLVWACNTSSSLTLFGSTPPLPIFPMLGFLANPLLGCVGFHAIEVSDGQIIPVWAYGATHSYLVNKTATVALQTLDNQGTNGVIPAILWE
jgi:hypothetical protein